jgi:hypothetical protein
MYTLTAESGGEAVAYVDATEVDRLSYAPGPWNATRVSAGTDVEYMDNNTFDTTSFGVIIMEGNGDLSVMSLLEGTQVYKNGQALTTLAAGASASVTGLSAGDMVSSDKPIGVTTALTVFRLDLKTRSLSIPAPHHPFDFTVRRGLLISDVTVSLNPLDVMHSSYLGAGNPQAAQTHGIMSLASQTLSFYRHGTGGELLKNGSAVDWETPLQVAQGDMFTSTGAPATTLGDVAVFSPPFLGRRFAFDFQDSSNHTLRIGLFPGSEPVTFSWEGVSYVLTSFLEISTQTFDLEFGSPVACSLDGNCLPAVQPAWVNLKGPSGTPVFSANPDIDSATPSGFGILSTGAFVGPPVTGVAYAAGGEAYYPSSARYVQGGQEYTGVPLSAGLVEFLDPVYSESLCIVPKVQRDWVAVSQVSGVTATQGQVLEAWGPEGQIVFPDDTNSLIAPRGSHFVWKQEGVYVVANPGSLQAEVTVIVNQVPVETVSIPGLSKHSVSALYADVEFLSTQDICVYSTGSGFICPLHTGDLYGLTQVPVADTSGTPVSPSMEFGFSITSPNIVQTGTNWTYSGSFGGTYSDAVINGETVPTFTQTAYGYMIIKGQNAAPTRSVAITFRPPGDITDDAHTGDKNILIAFDKNNNNTQIRVEYGDQGRLELFHALLVGQVGTLLGTGTGQVKAGEFNTIMITRDTSNLVYSVYLNGVVDIEHTFGTPPDIPDSCFIQCVRDLSTPRSYAQVYKVQAWEATLTQAEAWASSIIKASSQVQSFTGSVDPGTAPAVQTVVSGSAVKASGVRFAARCPLPMFPVTSMRTSVKAPAAGTIYAVGPDESGEPVVTEHEVQSGDFVTSDSPRIFYMNGIRLDAYNPVSPHRDVTVRALEAGEINGQAVSAGDTFATTDQELSGTALFVACMNGVPVSPAGMETVKGVLSHNATHPMFVYSGNSEAGVARPGFDTWDYSPNSSAVSIDPFASKLMVKLDSGTVEPVTGSVPSGYVGDQGYTEAIDRGPGGVELSEITLESRVLTHEDITRLYQAKLGKRVPGISYSKHVSMEQGLGKATVLTLDPAGAPVVTASPLSLSRPFTVVVTVDMKGDGTIVEVGDTLLKANQGSVEMVMRDTTVLSSPVSFPAEIGMTMRFDGSSLFVLGGGDLTTSEISFSTGAQHLKFLEAAPVGSSLSKALMFAGEAHPSSLSKRGMPFDGLGTVSLAVIGEDSSGNTETLQTTVQVVPTPPELKVSASFSDAGIAVRAETSGAVTINGESVTGPDITVEDPGTDTVTLVVRATDAFSQTTERTVVLNRVLDRSGTGVYLLENISVSSTEAEIRATYDSPGSEVSLRATPAGYGQTGLVLSQPLAVSGQGTAVFTVSGLVPGRTYDIQARDSLRGDQTSVAIVTPDIDTPVLHGLHTHNDGSVTVAIASVSDGHGGAMTVHFAPGVLSSAEEVRAQSHTSVVLVARTRTPVRVNMPQGAVSCSLGDLFLTSDPGSVSGGGGVVLGVLASTGAAVPPIVTSAVVDIDFGNQDTSSVAVPSVGASVTALSTSSVSFTQDSETFQAVSYPIPSNSTSLENMFDNDTTTRTIFVNYSPYIDVTFPFPFVCTGFILLSKESDNAYIYPRLIKVSGASGTSSTFTELASEAVVYVNSQNYGSPVLADETYKQFQFENTQAFTKFRIQGFRNSLSDSYVVFSGIRLLGTRADVPVFIDPIRGAVADLRGETFMTLPYAPVFDTTTATYAMWVYLTNTDVNSFYSIVRHTGYDGSNGFSLYLYRVSTGYKAHSQWVGRPGAQYAATGYTETIHELNDEWHHLTFVFTSSTIVVYLDGEPWESMTWNFTGVATGNFVDIFGGQANNAYEVDSFVDDLRVWDFALTQEQIQENYYYSGSSGTTYFVASDSDTVFLDTTPGTAQLISASALRMHGAALSLPDPLDTQSLEFASADDLPAGLRVGDTYTVLTSENLGAGVYIPECSVTLTPGAAGSSLYPFCSVHGHSMGATYGGMPIMEGGGGTQDIQVTVESGLFVFTPVPALSENTEYRFIQSEASNLGHPLRFSTADNDVNQVHESVNVGVPGQSARNVIIPSGVNVFLGTQDFQGGHPHATKTDARGILGGDSYFLNTGGVIGIDYTVDLPEAGEYLCTFRVEDRDNPTGNFSAYSHYGWFAVQMFDSDGTGLTYSDRTLVEHTTAELTVNVNYALYISWKGQRNDNIAHATFKVTVPSPGVHRLYMVTVGPENDTPFSMYFNFSLSPPTVPEASNANGLTVLGRTVYPSTHRYHEGTIALSGMSTVSCVAEGSNQVTVASVVAPQASPVPYSFHSESNSSVPWVNEHVITYFEYNIEVTQTSRQEIVGIIEVQFVDANGTAVYLDDVKAVLKSPTSVPAGTYAVGDEVPFPVNGQLTEETGGRLVWAGGNADGGSTLLTILLPDSYIPAQDAVAMKIWWEMDYRRPAINVTDKYGVSLGTFARGGTNTSIRPNPRTVPLNPHTPLVNGGGGSGNYTWVDSGMTGYSELVNGDRVYHSGGSQPLYHPGMLFNDSFSEWTSGFHNASGVNTFDVGYRFSGQVTLDRMSFRQVQTSNTDHYHFIGTVQISYWSGSAWVVVQNASRTGFDTSTGFVSGDLILITFSDATSRYWKATVSKHPLSTTDYTGFAEWTLGLQGSDFTAPYGSLVVTALSNSEGTATLTVADESPVTAYVLSTGVATTTGDEVRSTGSQHSFPLGTGSLSLGPFSLTPLEPTYVHALLEDTTGHRNSLYAVMTGQSAPPLTLDAVSGSASYNSSNNVSTVTVNFTGISFYDDAQPPQVELFRYSTYSGGILNFSGTSQNTSRTFSETVTPVQTRTYYVQLTRGSEVIQTTVTISNTGRKRTPTEFIDVEHVSAVNECKIHRFGDSSFAHYMSNRTHYPGYSLNPSNASSWIRNAGDDPWQYGSHDIELMSGTRRFMKFTFAKSQEFLQNPFYVFYEQGETHVTQFNFYKTGTNTLVCRLTSGGSTNITSNGRTRKRTSYSLTVYWQNV